MFRGYSNVLKFLVFLGLIAGCKQRQTSSSKGIVLSGNYSFLIYEEDDKITVSCVGIPLPKNYPSMSSEELKEACRGSKDVSIKSVDDFRRRLDREILLSLRLGVYSDFKEYLKTEVIPALNENREKLKAFAIVSKEVGVDFSDKVQALEKENSRLTKIAGTTATSLYHKEMAKELGEYFQNVESFNNSYATMFSQLLIDPKIQTVSSETFPLLSEAVRKVLDNINLDLPLAKEPVQAILDTLTADIQPLPITKRSHIVTSGPHFEFLTKSWSGPNKNIKRKTKDGELFMLFSDGVLRFNSRGWKWGNRLHMIVGGGYTYGPISEEYKTKILEKLNTHNSVSFIEYLIPESSYNEVSRRYHERKRLASFFSRVEILKNPSIYIIEDYVYAYSGISNSLRTYFSKEHYDAMVKIFKEWRPKATYYASNDRELSALVSKIKEKYPRLSHKRYSVDIGGDCLILSTVNEEDGLLVPEEICELW